MTLSERFVYLVPAGTGPGGEDLFTVQRQKNGDAAKDHLEDALLDTEHSVPIRHADSPGPTFGRVSLGQDTLLGRGNGNAAGLTASQVRSLLQTYQSSEVDTLLGGKSDIGHLHGLASLIVDGFIAKADKAKADAAIPFAVGSNINKIFDCCDWQADKAYPGWSIPATATRQLHKIAQGFLPAMALSNGGQLRLRCSGHWLTGSFNPALLFKLTIGDRVIRPLEQENPAVGTVDGWEFSTNTLPPRTLHRLAGSNTVDGYHSGGGTGVSGFNRWVLDVTIQSLGEFGRATGIYDNAAGPGEGGTLLTTGSLEIGALVSNNYGIPDSLEHAWPPATATAEVTEVWHVGLWWVAVVDDASPNSPAKEPSSGSSWSLYWRLKILKAQIRHINHFNQENPAEVMLEVGGPVQEDPSGAPPWDSGTTYDPLDPVSFGGLDYVATVTHNNQQPDTQTLFWMRAFGKDVMQIDAASLYWIGGQGGLEINHGG